MGFSKVKVLNTVVPESYGMKGSGPEYDVARHDVPLFPPRDVVWIDAFAVGGQLS